MTMPALGKNQAGTSPPAQGEPAHRLAVTALAQLTHAVADLAAALETTLAEWYRKARWEKYPPGKLPGSTVR